MAAILIFNACGIWLEVGVLNFSQTWHAQSYGSRAGTCLCRRERAWSSVNPSRSTQRCSCRASSLHVTTTLKSHSQCRFDSNSNGASSTTASTLPANTLFTISQIILAPILVCVILLRRACQQGQRTAASRSADLFSIRRDGGCSNTSAPRAFRSI